MIFFFVKTTSDPSLANYKTAKAALLREINAWLI